ncbi:MAG: aminopeptidase P family N-terminal domain-containing protein, partial [Candidatus Kapaibacteriota bacterium]
MAKKSTSDLEVKKSYPEKINQRLQQIRFRCEEEKVDGLFVNYLPHIRYLTNFSGSSAAIFIFQDEIW